MILKGRIVGYTWKNGLPEVTIQIERGDATIEFNKLVEIKEVK